MSVLQIDEKIKLRFEQKFDKTNDSECWNWQAGTNAGGYGSFNFLGKPTLAHRLSYEMHVSKIPEGLCVMHICDNPACVNPKHLRLGSRIDNNLDRHLKRRDGMGERNRHAKLNEDQVLQIRDLHLKGETEANLARQFNVKPNTVNSILHRKSWKHI